MEGFGLSLSGFSVVPSCVMIAVLRAGENFEK
jgi:hypothetical protein